jgi:hypothetical protein
MIVINVSIGNKRCRIYLVMTSKEEEDTWHTFNKCFDAIFIEAQWTCANITMEDICKHSPLFVIEC